ncbi:amidohydrolase family protein [Streptomyces rhizosphaerihabitans]|uniref:amidohydrolase family protein n=1 Tax=Streptomyces rhizosphaerihabitans TaxID=1266770 RepID=UPI0021BE5DE0|nr:amidohydrolase family protein [Streptomyces rhizosphaerihabitans]MCT9008490.1 amidohydrolase family protein [Streptomyces rhizosphaerihabitans]
MSDSPTIIDFHSHIASEMCFPKSFQDGVVENMTVALESRGLPVTREKVARMHAGTLTDPLCDELVRQMDEAGIAESVLLLPDFTYALKDSTHTIEELIEHHRVVVERHPGRFRVLVGVDPRWGADGLALFEKAIVDYRFDGMKLYPPCGYKLSDELLYPYYEICAQYALPVLSHIGATSPVLDFEIAQPIFVDKAAKDFPGIDFVLAHGSVHYPDEVAMLCNNRPNIYVDVSGYEAFGVEALNKLFRRGINHKIIFGTDWPVFRLQGRQLSLVEKLEKEGAFPDSMSAADRDLFFHKNAARLLGKNKLKSTVAGTDGG